jgi:hypothetical protein
MSSVRTPRAAAYLTVTHAGWLALPALFAVFPLLSLFQQNETDVELHVLWWPLLLCVVGGAVLYGVLLAVVRRPANASVLASLVVVWFAYYEPIAGQISGSTPDRWWFFGLWTAVFAVAAAAIVRTRLDLSKLTLILAVAALVLVAGPLARISVYQANHEPISLSDPRLWPDRLAKPSVTDPSRLPDIYFLIPDDYARLDVLAKYFHYSDAAFVNELRKRRFAISQGSRSPYSDSESNIAAALNMGYLDGLPKILGAKSQDVRPVKRLIADSRASRLLKSLGYRYIHLDTDEVTFPFGNPRISSAAVPDSIENLWLQKTVLRKFGGPIGFDQKARDRRFRDSIETIFSRLAAVAAEQGPKFVVFHTLLPHDPYVYGSNGQAVTFPYHSDTALGSRVGMPYYLHQLEFVNRKLLEAVDAIRSRSKTSAIVIQSDEGFQGEADTFGEATMQQIRVKGLLALFLPGRVDAGVPKPPNTVNTLRFVFNQYLGTHYPLLPTHSYPELDYPYQFEEMRVR